MAEEETVQDPEVEYSLLSGQDKAALLMSTLGTNTSQLIFSNLRDNDVKRMINAMSNIKKSADLDDQKST